MVSINKVTVAWDGLPANICRAVKKWAPGPLPREIDYRDSLAAHLRECAPHARIECEYRHLGTTVDIYVEWSGLMSKSAVYIEMKRNLRTKAEYNRLVGQIEDLKPGSHLVILVLCGETAENWFDRLKSRYRGLLGLGMWICTVQD